MTAVPIEQNTGSDLSRVVELVARAHGHEVVTLTENGQPVAVVLSPQEWESITETLDVLSNPGEFEDIQASKAEFARGEGIDGMTAIGKYLSRQPGGPAGYQPRHSRED